MRYMEINNKLKMKKVNKYIILITVFVLICSCKGNLQKVELGDYLITTVIDNSESLINPRSDIVTSYKYTLDDIDYRLSLDSQNKINFISTFDRKLVLEDGVKVGSFFKDLKSEKIEYLRGWGYYTKVTSKWFAYISSKETPNDTMKVKALFQYNDFPKKSSDSIKLDFSGNRLKLKK